MIKAHYIVCSKYRKTEKTKISYIFKIRLGFCFACSKCTNKNQK